MIGEGVVVADSYACVGVDVAKLKTLCVRGNMPAKETFASCEVDTSSAGMRWVCKRIGC